MPSETSENAKKETAEANNTEHANPMRELDPARRMNAKLKIETRKTCQEIESTNKATANLCEMLESNTTTLPIDTAKFRILKAKSRLRNPGMCRIVTQTTREGELHTRPHLKCPIDLGKLQR